MTPGPHPVAALAAAMPGTGPPPVLVVDQCEEVFSLCHDASRARDLPDRAGRPSSGGALILSFRADRLADISAHPAFARTIERGLYLLSGMTQDRPAGGDRGAGPAGRADRSNRAWSTC